MSTRSSAHLAHKKAKVTQSHDDEARDDSLFDNSHSGYHTLHLVRHGARDPSAESDESESEQPSPQNHRLSTSKKRKSTQGKKTRGKQGRLSELIHMPMEIFTEIMSHLMPVDVLALSRANKSFRKLLMNRSSIHIWHATMDNVPGLPPCPEGMSEPSYLAVLFLKTCTLCGDTARTGLDEVLVDRLCASCRSTSLTPLENVPSELLPFIHIAQCRLSEPH
ncbi:unnamed protein product [Rhizoctonia solani]|uniref:F-box domain-containing protein n=1 Tax=Rhizoctonia solani TaxID=456999 RepID=A0A8H3HPN2_9AGAM|nr:unnamed protein product [Rhizoctonia solani]